MEGKRPRGRPHSRWPDNFKYLYYCITMYLHSYHLNCTSTGMTDWNWTQMLAFFPALIHTHPLFPLYSTILHKNHGRPLYVYEVLCRYDWRFWSRSHSVLLTKFMAMSRKCSRRYLASLTEELWMMDEASTVSPSPLLSIMQTISLCWSVTICATYSRLACSRVCSSCSLWMYSSSPSYVQMARHINRQACRQTEQILLSLLVKCFLIWF